MIVLAGHRTEPAHLPEQPLEHLVARAQILAEELAGLFREVEQDRARLENRDRLAAVGRRVIDDGGNAVVRRYRQKVRLELFAFADVDWDNIVLQSGLFEKNRYLVTVRRGPVIEIDHGGGPF